MIAVAEQEDRVLEDQLAEQVGLPRLGVVAVGHVGLVAEIHEPLVLEIGPAVRPGLQVVVVEVVEREDRLQHGEAADARIEHADR